MTDSESSAIPPFEEDDHRVCAHFIPSYPTTTTTRVQCSSVFD